MQDRNIRPKDDICKSHVVRLLLFLALICAADGQQMLPTKPPSLSTAISRLRAGSFSPSDIEVIARQHDMQAIPLLETQFKRMRDPVTKGKIANVLVRLGEKNGPYWDFLVNQTRQALKDEPPTPFDFDANGKAEPANPSKQFSEWAKKHNLSLSQAWQYTMVVAMGSIIDLGSSDDERAVPVLREALASKNDFVKVAAAQGLAELHDTASVPKIIEACRKAPKEVASSLAQSLVYFDDPAAQRAVDKYVSASTARDLREARGHGKTPYR